MRFVTETKRKALDHYRLLLLLVVQSGGKVEYREKEVSGRDVDCAITAPLSRRVLSRHKNGTTTVVVDSGPNAISC